MKKLVASAVLALSVGVCLCSSAQEKQELASGSATAIVLAELPVSASTGSELAGSAEVLPTAAGASRDAMLVTPNFQPSGVAAAPEVKMRQPKVVDKKFMTLGFLAFATTSLDMELTQHCLQRNTCVELNPTLPTSHWGMYATNTPVNAAVMYLAYKRRKGGHWDWWLWPAIDTGIHIYGVTTNARYAWGGR